MKKAAIALSIASIALLNVILAVGNGRSSDALFNVSIELLPVFMLPSSVLLAYFLISRGHRVIGALFALNVMLFFLALGLMAAGRPLNAGALFIADVLQLNLYVVALTKHWTLLATSGVQRPMPTGTSY